MGVFWGVREVEDNDDFEDWGEGGKENKAAYSIFGGSS